MAQPTILIDNDKVKVTKWLLDVGDSTGHHIHENNYIVVPMLDGELKILEKNNNETISKLIKVELIIEKKVSNIMFLITMNFLIPLLKVN